MTAVAMSTALPVTFGIAVDYPVNFPRRLRDVGVATSWRRASERGRLDHRA